MNSYLRQQRSSSLLSALATIALGVVLLIWPEGSVRIVCLLLGGALLLLAIFHAHGASSRRERGPFLLLRLLPSILLAGIGVWLMSQPSSVAMLVQYVFAILILVHSALDLQGAVALCHVKAPRWGLELMITLLTFALGALILLNPFGTFAALLVLLGWALILDGGGHLWLILRLSFIFRGTECTAQKDEAADE